jgi:hypothetical protein
MPHVRYSGIFLRIDLVKSRKACRNSQFLGLYAGSIKYKAGMPNAQFTRNLINRSV